MSKPTDSQLRFLALSLCSMTLISGPVAYGIYRLITHLLPIPRLALYQKADIISEIVITSSITLMGFLATIITILFSISTSKAFTRYKNMKYHHVFFALYYLSLVCLGVTAVFAFAVFSSVHGQALFPWMIMLSISSAVQVVCVTWIIIVNAQKSFCSAP